MYSRLTNASAGNSSSATSGHEQVDLHEADDGKDDEDDHADAERERVEELGGAEDVGVGMGEQLARRLRHGDSPSGRRDTCR